MCSGECLGRKPRTYILKQNNGSSVGGYCWQMSSGEMCTNLMGDALKKVQQREQNGNNRSFCAVNKIRCVVHGVDLVLKGAPLILRGPVVRVT